MMRARFNRLRAVGNALGAALALGSALLVNPLAATAVEGVAANPALPQPATAAQPAPAQTAAQAPLAPPQSGAPSSSAPGKPFTPMMQPRPRERPPPGRSRVLGITRTSVPPTLDGALDDAAWKGAALAGGFWISEQERWPREQTEVLVTFDAQYLYFGFRVYDSHPQTIQALQTRRGAGLGLDDQVAVELDPFLSHREISTYSVSAAGVQDDAIAGGRARQLAWKGDWQAAAVRTAYGWSAEIAVPFSILNFHEGTSAVGVNFLRYHHRAGEWSRWADITVRALPEEMGRLTGLTFPSTRTQPWTVMPYVLAGRHIPDKRGRLRDTLVTGGAEIRYQPRPNLTGVLSLNPDFSQVESAITNINFNYNERFRADPRPFFQEGSAYFGDTPQYFYSNRIPDFDYGAKFFTRTGQYQLGALATKAPFGRSDYVVRGQREFDAAHSVAGMVVASQREDVENQLYVLRGQGRERSGLNYAFDAAGTTTSQQRGDGNKLYGSVGWAQDYWSVGVAADRYTVDYRPLNGLLDLDLPDTRGVTTFGTYYRDFGTEAAIRELRGDVSYVARQIGDGRTQRRFVTGGGSVEVQQQVRAGLWYATGVYRPVAGGPGLWSPTLNDDHYWTATLDFNTRSSRLGYGASKSSGFLNGGDYEYWNVYAWARPTGTTFVNVTSERLSNFGDFDQTIISAGWDITSTQTLVGRYITAYYGEAYRLAYSLNVRKNVDFFLVYDREPFALARISTKVVMTFQ